MITSPMVVAALTTIPESHPRIIDLAWKCLGKDGTLDDEQLLLNRKEIQEAADEATAYQRKNRETLELLKKLARR